MTVKTTRTTKVAGYALTIVNRAGGSRNAICEWCGWVSPHLGVDEAAAVRQCPTCGLVRGAQGLTVVRAFTGTEDQ